MNRGRGKRQEIGGGRRGGLSLLIGPLLPLSDAHFHCFPCFCFCLFVCLSVFFALLWCSLCPCFDMLPFQRLSVLVKPITSYALTDTQG